MGFVNINNKVTVKKEQIEAILNISDRYDIEEHISYILDGQDTLEEYIIEIPFVNIVLSSNKVIEVPLLIDVTENIDKQLSKAWGRLMTNMKCEYVSLDIN